MTARPEQLAPVVVLAGGLGRRLRPATESLPKPMLPVGGRPFLHWLLDGLARQGLRHFILAVGHRWEVIRDHFGDGSAFGWRIDYSVEDRPMGTGGAVLWAQPTWGRPVLVLNGDTFLGGDWPAMLAAHAAAGLPATMAVVWQEHAGRFGRAAVRDGRVTEFVEKDPADPPGWINGGAYVLDASALGGFRRGSAFSLERDVFPALVGRIAAFPCRGPFADIGTPASLEQFRRFPAPGP